MSLLEEMRKQSVVISRISYLDITVAWRVDRTRLQLSTTGTVSSRAMVRLARAGLGCVGINPILIAKALI